ncbi:HAMP domain-containing sensor histidine kinase [Candidatus Methylospira mobilis]|uniref:sensor histidine kinase n=1 Tax=Candidatus Methylospira mobilis TaxID=1808979 RepID=UPI0028EDB1B7|nr:HAMP domain-containing sensor histidine kinase [Candidatus Methylospira mobilis]WNV04498.1 HAMP domain-containing sensor histidine kinase [Candidatus Methylospira mobilis]
MRAYFQRFIARIYLSIEQRVHLFEPRILAISLIAVTAFPLYYFIWRDIFPQPYENLPLRLIGSALFCPLLFIKYWTIPMRRYLSIYWYIGMTYALPFFFTFMLLKNEGNTVWLLSSLIASFIMILLLDWLNLLVQFVLGVSIAWLAYYATTSSAQVNFITLESIPIYLFAIILGSIANYSAEMLEQARLRAVLATASNIAHELRTPLLGIKTGAAGLRRYLPALLETYQAAKEHGLLVTPIRLAHLHAMNGVLERIENEADHSNVIIDMLLKNTRLDGFQTEHFTVCSIACCVKTALQRYPFVSEKEKLLILLDHETDFSFNGIEMLMVHILFNLMKNALYHIAKANKGEIWIKMQKSQHGNRLIFRDTGTGIPAEVLPHIFNCFYSWSPINDSGLGAGIGLAFCRSVMKAFGGAITCKSELGVYTEFTLTFPPTEAK